MLRVMLEAPFLLIRAALPHMYEQGFGRVLNVSSVHGLRASAYKSAYVAAKHGLEGLSKVTALEGGPHGVTSNCINPTYVRMPLVEAQIPGQAKLHGLREDQVVTDLLLAESAIKRLAEPDEVASLALWNPQATGPVVLAIHGITASHYSWPFLARALPDTRIIAPDLRGRARSNLLPGPYGMRRHAADPPAG